MVPEGFPDNGNAPLDILIIGRKKYIKTANISILSYIGTPCRKTKTQIFNNLVIILRDSFVGVISDINNNNSSTISYFA